MLEALGAPTRAQCFGLAPPRPTLPTTMVMRHGIRGAAPTLHLLRATTYDGDDGAAAADAAAAAAAGVEARI